MLPRICLSMQRFLLPLWVGAAVLFVLTSVAEQRSAWFEPGVKNQLALIRFPYYYAFGLGAMVTALACGGGRLSARRRCRSTLIVFTLLAVVTTLMIVDYLFVYRPLAALMLEPFRERGSDFTIYHQASKYINAIEILLCTVAALVVCREPRSAASSPDRVPPESP